MNKIQALFTGFATVVGAGGIAAYNGVFDAPKPLAVVEQTQPAKILEKPVEVAKVDPAAPAPEIAPEKPAEAAPVAATTEAAAVVAETVAPVFGMLRAEPDGSLLVAGQATPGADIELLTASTVLGKIKAEPNGDFAMVLSNPLKPGDYSLVLRATNPDGKVASSIQTATVSIPDKSDGQVLALVEEPGKPSRIITAPEAEKPAEVAAPTPAVEPAPATTEVAKAETPAAPADETPATPAAETPAAPTAETPAASDTATAPSAVETPAATAETPAVVAAEPVKPAAAAPNEIVVEAVEIEGRKIFIAGSAKAGSNIRIYANETLLGDTKATENNRFLLELERDLPIGDYIVRADSLDADGVTVLARTAVPFKREEGEAVAAVATPQAPKSVEPAASSEAPAATATAEAVVPEVEVVAIAPADEVVAVAPSAESKVVATAPALTKVESSVIIRRGDSLWRISRRIYGRGVRYSTIYLANKGQVENPNRIWPGQVMVIPEKTAEGESADMAEIEKRKTDTANQQ